MDLFIPLVFIGVFVVACLSLVFVYKYGMKEKSYEEAVAEQRQHTHALLGAKAKPKEKKPKKPSKKQSKETKGKPSSVKGHESDESENAESNVSENIPKIHVEFKEEPEEVPIKEVVQVPVKPKRVKKVRPILIKKERSPEKVVLDVLETPVANHFEEKPPKDDLELKRSTSREDVSKQEIKEKNNQKEKKPSPEVAPSAPKEKKSNLEAAPPIPKEKKPTTEVVPPTRNSKKQQKQTTTNSTIEPVSNGSLPEKEKEIEEKPLQPVLSAPLTNGIIGNPGKEKKKKKSEYNTMQQLTADRDGLINSVRKAELSKYEIQLLIDLLLNKQLEAPAIIDEWSEGKSDPVQKLKKQLAEKEKALAEEKEALVSAQAKLKEVRAEQQTERAQLQQKVRALDEILQNKQIEMQAANNRAQVNAQKIQQLQNDLNNEVMKVRKYMDDNAALQMQIQQIKDNDTVAALRHELEELSNQHQQLLMERQQILREKDHQHQQFLAQMREMDNNLEQQLKESKQMLERDFNVECTKLKAAIQQQYDEKVNIEMTLHQKLEELREVNNEKVESMKIIAQLKGELKLLQDKLVHDSETAEETKTYEVRILNLNNELSSMKNELNSMKNELQSTEKKYKTELDTCSKVRESIQKELEEQKVKNNELRAKNWKVMEALNAAESRLKGSPNATNSQANNNLASEIKSREQEAQKQFILRLFPEIEDLKSVSADDWQEEFGGLIRNYISSLQTSQKKASPLSSPQKTQDIAKLQAQIQHYANIIDETEGMLNKLQLHVETEEIKWRTQLAAKDAEIEQIKETRLNTLENKVASLEQQLAQSLEEKQRLQEEFQLLKSHSQKSQSSHKYSDPTATIEQLSEELNRLKEQLRLEQSKNGDVICLKTQNNFNSSRNGSALIEHCLSSSSSLASSLIEGLNKKPKNKKRKKKGTEQ